MPHAVAADADELAPEICPFRLPMSSAESYCHGMSPYSYRRYGYSDHWSMVILSTAYSVAYSPSGSTLLRSSPSGR
eukprot:SAG11_NODE_2242_length_3643_cov_7.584368_3_plen_76_part_00